ncbi:SGNH hydrolase domain-containing protein [Cellulomonas uda]|uniref:SGNH domain-containing protein n=1 Tax=Cellulomonas uda TaxID=1714 RepID=A0A4Y3KAE3_CELUD|nr:SGNH hydrolase domain-containing protein [Cellulomonas uda]NII65309.1 hypothetical protein [Cellulomonas uda]GEA79790.1 hypothetical protein CUD01_02340 [Cellulomonas uda]
MSALRRTRLPGALAALVALVALLAVGVPAPAARADGPAGGSSTRATTGGAARAGTEAAATTSRRVTGFAARGTGGPGTLRVFSGRVLPAADQAPVVLQRWTAGSWVTVARARTGSGGGFDLRVRPDALGNRQYRVVAPAWYGRPWVASGALDVGAYGDLTRVLGTGVPCLGAAAMDPRDRPCTNPDLSGSIRPDPRRDGWQDDTGGAFSCYVAAVTERVRSCTYGSRSRDALRVAVTGDSHGAMTLPGLRDSAARLNWRLDTYVAQGCLLADPGPAEHACHLRRADLLRRLVAGRYDVVVVTGYRETGATPDAMAVAWRRLQEAGTLVVAIVDNPIMSRSALTCATGATTVRVALACRTPRDVALATPDPLRKAHALVPGSVLVDTTSLLCTSSVCRPVVGHVMAYRDRHHLSATMSRTLAPYRLDRIAAAL